MKNNFKSIILFTLAAVILSSCGTLNVTKRLHNKGYHVSYSKHYSSESKEEDKSVVEEHTTTKTESESVSKTGMNLPTERVKMKTQNPTEVINKNESAEVIQKGVKDKTGFNNMKATDLKSFITPSKLIFGNDAQETTIQKMPPVRDGGMSMLWIIIIIVLILWLLGYLGGLGSFIHLLLVIALILLILWLLRII
jgi:hypothetical protein